MIPADSIDTLDTTIPADSIDTLDTEPSLTPIDDRRQIVKALEYGRKWRQLHWQFFMLFKFDVAGHL